MLLVVLGFRSSASERAASAGELRYRTIGSLIEPAGHLAVPAKCHHNHRGAAGQQADAHERAEHHWVSDTSVMADAISFAMPEPNSQYQRLDCACL